MPKPSPKPGFQRSKQLIKPRLQWKVMLVFACVAACAVLLQSITLAGMMTLLANELPHDGNVLMDKMIGFLWINLLISLAFILPLHLIVGRTVTFKIAGPLYRFEMYLKQLIRGERPGPCRIRKDDELQDFCQILNEAVKPLSQPLEGQVDECAQAGESEQPPGALPASEGVEGTLAVERENETATEQR